MQKLTGVARTVAVEAYSAALERMFVASVGLALTMLLVQAGVGWRSRAKTEVDVQEQ